MHPPPFAGVRAALQYATAAAVLVQAFKFNGDLSAGNLLGSLLADAVADEPRPDVIVPVPSSRKRRRERGFDPAVELARPVAAIQGVSMDLRAASRPVHRDSQSTVAWSERWANVQDVFHVKPGRLEGRRVAVVDDVMTSGATATSLATCLLAAGAEGVAVWVACRAGGPGGGLTRPGSPPKGRCSG